MRDIFVMVELVLPLSVDPVRGRGLVETALTAARRAAMLALAAGALMVALLARSGFDRPAARRAAAGNSFRAARHRAPRPLGHPPGRDQDRQGPSRASAAPRSGSWTFDRPDGPGVPSELASHLETALQFMHVSEPARTLDPATTGTPTSPISGSIHRLTWSRWSSRRQIRDRCGLRHAQSGADLAVRPARRPAQRSTFCPATSGRSGN